MGLNNAHEQVYFFENQFPNFPEGESPIRITERQYSYAVDDLEQRGMYIPSKENPNGDSFSVHDRKFLLENSLVELNGFSQIHMGGETQTIRIYSEMKSNIERCAKGLGLPLPQWHLAKRS